MQNEPPLKHCPPTQCAEPTTVTYREVPPEEAWRNYVEEVRNGTRYRGVLYAHPIQDRVFYEPAYILKLQQGDDDSDND